MASPVLLLNLQLALSNILDGGNVDEDEEG
jgi:hypothetical protein